MRDFRNELRLNNWLLTPDGFISLSQLRMELIMRKGETQDYSPILLTPKILEQTDFKKTNGKISDIIGGIEGEGFSYRNYQYFTNVFLFEIFVDADMVLDPLYQVREVIYLHQLQNLIFSLDGRELNVYLKDAVVVVS